MNYTNVRERLPVLIKILENINTELRSEKKYLGEAQAYLNLLIDIIDSIACDWTKILVNSGSGGSPPPAFPP